MAADGRIQIRIGIVGTGQAALQRAKAMIRPALVGGMRELMNDAWRIASQLVTGQVVKVRSGHLRRTIGPPKVTATGDLIQGSLAATAKYAKPIEEGSRPHIIRVRQAKALRFFAASGMGPVRLTRRGKVSATGNRAVGAFVFAKFVRHPGTPPRPFMAPALKRVRQGPPAATDRLRLAVLQTIRGR